MATTEAVELKIANPRIRAAFARAVRSMYLAGVSLDPRSAEVAGRAFEDLVRAAGGADREGWQQLVSAAAVAGPANWPTDLDDRAHN